MSKVLIDKEIEAKAAIGYVRKLGLGQVVFLVLMVYILINKYDNLVFNISFLMLWLLHVEASRARLHLDDLLYNKKRLLNVFMMAFSILMSISCLVSIYKHFE